MPETNSPTGIDQESYDKAKEIIVSGFEHEQDQDAIKTALMNTGLFSFSSLLKVYKAITIDEGLVLSRTEVQEKIMTGLEGKDFDEDTTFDFCEEVAKVITDENKGITQAQVFSRIKAIMEDQDLTFPKKPRALKSRSGKVTNIIINLFADSLDVTLDEFKEALADVTNEKTIKKWLVLYPTFVAIAKGDKV